MNLVCHRFKYSLFRTHSDFKVSADHWVKLEFTYISFYHWRTMSFFNSSSSSWVNGAYIWGCFEVHENKFKKTAQQSKWATPWTKYKRLPAYYINVAYSLVVVFRKHNEPHWELHTRERLSIDVSLVPLPLSLWDICSSCPLVLLSAGQRVCVFAWVCALVEVGLAGRLVWGVLWHLPLWRGLARTLVGHHIYQWLIVTSRSPWKHNRDLWPLFSTKAARWSH